MSTYDKAKQSADFLLASTKYRPKIAVICGTGLGALSDMVENPDCFPYEAIPNFPACTAPGHAGKMVFGRLRGVDVVLMKGRFHMYEGHDMATCAFPVRVWFLMGVEKLMSTAAAGGLNQDFAVGDFMMIEDHVSFPGFAGRNPLTGANDERFGPRFIPLDDAYSPALRQVGREVASEVGMDLKEGVYVQLGGPSFETPAELRMLKALGVDAVGMSVVHEIITARHCGMEAIAFAAIGNMCVLQVQKHKRSAEEVQALAYEVIDGIKPFEQNLKLFVSTLIERINAM